MINKQSHECPEAEAAARPVICCSHLYKGFGENRVLQDLTFSIDPGSRVVLYGPSGSGKSTLLRLMAGLIVPDQGEMWVDPSCRLSLVFQEDRLFGGISCLENIMYGIYAGSQPKERIQAQARKWAEVFQCSDYLHQKTDTLSGGQRQRAALARAFMKDPEIVLMDESFSSMDAALKDELMNRLLDLQKERRFTMVVVTHNYDEARRMGEQMFVLKNGRIVQHGSVWDAVLRPADLFEAKAFGGYTWNLIPVDCLSFADFMPSGRMSIPVQARWAGISAYSCSCSPHPGWLKLAAQEQEVRNMGYCWMHLLDRNGSRLYAASRSPSYSGWVWLDPGQLLFFDEEGSLLEEERTSDENGTRIPADESAGQRV